MDALGISAGCGQSIYRVCASGTYADFEDLTGRRMQSSELQDKAVVFPKLAGGHNAGLHNRCEHRVACERRYLRGLTGRGASMRKGRRVATAFLLAVAFRAAARSAWADDPANEDQDTHILAALARPPSAKLTSDYPSQDQARFLLFATTDIWRQGGFAHSGLYGRRAGWIGMDRYSSSCSVAASITTSPARSEM